MTLKTGLGSVKVIGNVTIRQSTYDILLMFYSNYGAISCRFWDIQCQKMLWPWNPGQRSLKIIGTDTDRSATYLWLPINITQQPWAYLVPFPTKMEISVKICHFFLTPVYLTPLRKGFPLELSTDARGQITRMTGLPDGQKSFKIGLAV